MPIYEFYMTIFIIIIANNMVYCLSNGIYLENIIYQEVNTVKMTVSKTLFQQNLQVSLEVNTVKMTVVLTTYY